MKTFTLLTFNVEAFKNLYDYNYHPETKKITSVTKNKKKDAKSILGKIGHIFI